VLPTYLSLFVHICMPMFLCAMCGWVRRLLKWQVMIHICPVGRDAGLTYTAAEPAWTMSGSIVDQQPGALEGIYTATSPLPPLFFSAQFPAYNEFLFREIGTAGSMVTTVAADRWMGGRCLFTHGATCADVSELATVDLADGIQPGPAVGRPSAKGAGRGREDALPAQPSITPQSAVTTHACAMSVVRRVFTTVCTPAV